MSKSQEPKAEKSLCWNCTHGLCVQETEQERFVHTGMQGGESQDVFEQQSFDESETPELIEHTIAHERVKTICFWRPDTITQSPPIVVSVVTKCNRFNRK